MKSPLRGQHDGPRDCAEAKPFARLSRFIVRWKIIEWSKRGKGGNNDAQDVPQFQIYGRISNGKLKIQQIAPRVLAF